MNIGVLLVNLGTPAAAEKSAVYRYLIEFLTDGRVIDFSWLRRQLLVRGLIVPARYRASTAAYKHIWGEDGSPLLVYGRRLQDKLQQALGDDYVVALAMRYQRPSIDEALATLEGRGLRQLIIVPLFPQYASATTGSVHQAVMQHLQHWNVIPELTFIGSYATHPAFIAAFAEQIGNCHPADYDHVVFSFHGLPERHIHKASRRGCCLQPDCCRTLSLDNGDCYAAQCYATARALAATLSFAPERYSVSFQSRLGKERWLEPYTLDTLHLLLRQGHRRLLVASPAFVADCLETLYEIGIEYADDFKAKGGEALALVPSLNDTPQWIDALHTLVQERSLLTLPSRSYTVQKNS